MWLLILLSLGSAVGAEQDYTRNSVYHKFAPTYPSVLKTTEQTSQDVLKELGVDLTNEGKTKFLRNIFGLVLHSQTLIYLDSIGSNDFQKLRMNS